MKQLFIFLLILASVGLKAQTTTTLQNIIQTPLISSPNFHYDTLKGLSIGENSYNYPPGYTTLEYHATPLLNYTLLDSIDQSNANVHFGNDIQISNDTLIISNKDIRFIKIDDKVFEINRSIELKQVNKTGNVIWLGSGSNTSIGLDALHNYTTGQQN